MVAAALADGTATGKRLSKEDLQSMGRQELQEALQRASSASTLKDVKKKQKKESKDSKKKSKKDKTKAGGVAAMGVVAGKGNQRQAATRVKHGRLWIELKMRRKEGEGEGEGGAIELEVLVEEAKDLFAVNKNGSAR
jgi:hypothetical protein